MMTAILAVLMFALMIFPHELGHFIAAKAVGVKVNEFAFGMGPAIIKKQHGETLYSIRAFPIGGFCALEGEDGDSDNDRAFNTKPAWAKIVVLAAGSFMNVMVAVIVMVILMGAIGSPTLSVRTVESGSPAMEAGIRAGDTVTAVNGTRVEKWNDISQEIQKHPKEVRLSIERNGSRKTVSMTPEKKNKSYIIGITPQVTHNPALAVKNGLISVWQMTKSMFSGLGLLFTGKVSGDDVAGPVGMVSLVHQTVSYGLYYFFYLLSLICINLAIINLLPLPALDGGRIVFVIIRLITGKKVTDRMEAAVHAVGLLLLMLLMIAVTYNDVLKLFQ